MTQGIKRIMAALAVSAMAATAIAETVKPVKEGTMTAHGTFEVKMVPQPADSKGGSFARFLVDKKFQGDLEAVSKGQMLASGGPPASSGGYVALEEVTGTLHGKRGSFVLIHRGTMTNGSSHVDVTVVPDSGTGELAGIAGAMTLIVEGSKHSYEFSYVL